MLNRDQTSASNIRATAQTQTRLNTSLLIAALVLVAVMLGQSAQAATSNERTTFKRVKTQFIAALGDPQASSGTGAETWGIWRKDPGPRGVWLTNYKTQLEATEGRAPANWRHSNADWWLDENGLIMEQPDFPIPAGKYLVTGDREVVTMLTVHPVDAAGAQRWELANDAKLFDVTHLPCRSARYTPANGEGSCSPENADLTKFRVTPGDTMPPVPGCLKQDYAVIFIIGVEATD